MAWLSGGWGQRIEITVSNTNIGSDLTHFPLLLTLGTSVGTGADDVSAIFDELTSDANRLKIAVTESDGTTEIKAEIEDWDDVSESAHLWVAASGLTLSSSATTTLFIYYDSGHADNTANVGDVNSTPGAAVWDSDYVLVAHLSETTGTHLDSTSNSNDETAKSITDQDVATIINGGDNFNDDHIEFSNTGMVVGAGTISAWCKEDIDPTTSDDFVFAHRSAATNNRIYARDNLGVLEIRFVAEARVSLGDLSAGWHQVVVSWSGADYHGNLDDGVQTNNTAAGSLPSLDNAVTLGSYVELGTGQNFDGDMDEFRVSSILRTDDWINADYHSGLDNLVSWGNEELEPSGATGAPSITNIVSAGTAEVINTATGTPSITPIEAAGTAEVLNTATGSPSITAITASGVANVPPVITDVDGDETWDDGDTGLIITGTKFV